MEITGMTLLLLLLGLAGTSTAGTLFGLCDFETNDMCGLSESNGFDIENGKPSSNSQAMESGYSGDSYLLLNDFNSENKIYTPTLTHEQGKVQVHFAYYLNGDGESDSYIQMGVMIDGGHPVILWESDFHDHYWHYIAVSIDAAAYQNFQVVWTAFARNPILIQSRTYLGLDFIEVVESDSVGECLDPTPVQYADPWSCYPPSTGKEYVSHFVRETYPDGTICTTNCLDGFTMEGQPLLTCKNGAWEQSGNVNFICSDGLPPEFVSCPSNVEVETPFGWGSLWYTIEQPEVSDNTGAWDLMLYLNGEPQLNATLTLKLSPGNYDVLFVAIDLFMNENTCSYMISVSSGDKEPPQILSCPQSQTIESDVPVVVRWMQPAFQDNSGYLAKIENNYDSGSIMAWGFYEVIYTAYDNSTNSASCSFNITVHGLSCSVLDLPANGALVCHDSYAGMFCVTMCGSDRDFQVPSPNLPVSSNYLCSASGDWYPNDFTHDCLAPYDTEPIMSSDYYYQGPCDEITTQDSMRNQALSIYIAADVDATMGTNLTANDFYVSCGPFEPIHRFI